MKSCAINRPVVKPHKDIDAEKHVLLMVPPIFLSCYCDPTLFYPFAFLVRIIIYSPVYFMPVLFTFYAAVMLYITYKQLMRTEKKRWDLMGSIWWDGTKMAFTYLTIHAQVFSPKGPENIFPIFPPSRVNSNVTMRGWKDSTPFPFPT